MREKILDFIAHFQRPDTIEVFTNGMCYWFAVLLRERFGGDILYNMAVGHFVCDIDGELYDVTGDVTEQYNYDPMVYWDALPEYDNLLYERLMRDCVRKERK
jgi:hypothetical protein